MSSDEEEPPTHQKVHNLTRALGALRTTAVLALVLVALHQCYVIFYAGQASVHARELSELEEDLRAKATQLAQLVTQIAIEFCILILAVLAVFH